MIVIAFLLAAVAAIFSIRAVVRARKSGDYGTIFAVLAAALIIGLAVLAATGRLHWIAAVAAALVPFLKRIFGLLQYVPVLRRLMGANSGAAGTRPDPAGSAARPDSVAMTRDRAIEILGLGPRPTRDEITEAHRRLIQKLHPDRGGSTYLAQQLNEARKILLEGQT